MIRCHSLSIPNTGKVLLFARRSEGAIAQLQDTLKLDPDFSEAKIWLGVAYAETGRYDDALASLATVRDKNMSLAWTGYVYAKAGRRAAAGQVLLELEQMKASGPLSALCVYLGLGEKDKAFAALEQACETHSVAMTSLKVNPAYDSIRSDSRCAQLLRRVQLAP
ncbi:MAG: tetratricopeptide repeat protein [Chthoniobacterales bacterium]